MAGGVELSDMGPRSEDLEDQPNETTPYIISASEAAMIRNQEDALARYTGSSIEHQRRELLKTKVDAFLKAVAARDGLLPGPLIYDEFVLDDVDGRALYIKDGLKRVTYKNNTARYLALSTLERDLGVDWIRTHLFPIIKNPSRVSEK